MLGIDECEMRNSQKNIPTDIADRENLRISDRRMSFRTRPCPRCRNETTQPSGSEVARHGFVWEIKKLRCHDSPQGIIVPPDKIIPNVPEGTKLPRGFIKRIMGEYEPIGIFDEDANEKAEFIKRRMQDRLTDSEFWMVVQFAELKSNYSALARLYGVSQPTAKRKIKLIVKKILS